MSCLERVLKELNTDEDIERIIRCEIFEYMLEKEDKNNIDLSNISIKKFAEKLYKYRNSVVHGKKDWKKDDNLLSHIPMNLLDKEDKRKLEGWNSIANKLAYQSIKYFCFDNVDLYKFISIK